MSKFECLNELLAPGEVCCIAHEHLFLVPCTDCGICWMTSEQLAERRRLRTPEWVEKFLEWWKTEGYKKPSEPKGLKGEFLVLDETPCVILMNRFLEPCVDCGMCWMTDEELEEV